jgi:hypothetical protein
MKTNERKPLKIGEQVCLCVSERERKERERVVLEIKWKEKGEIFFLL